MTSALMRGRNLSIVRGSCQAPGSVDKMNVRAFVCLQVMAFLFLWHELATLNRVLE